MTQKPFSVEEMKELRKNSYVRTVSRTVVTYTDQFKEDFLRLLETGMSYRDIFKNLGFDEDILGLSRIFYTGRNICRRKRAGKPQEDQRKYNRLQERKQYTEAEMECRIREYRERYTMACLEVLKKRTYQAESAVLWMI